MTVDRVKWDQSISSQFYKHSVGLDFQKIKHHINNGYSVIQRVSRVFINVNGQLCISNRVLIPSKKQLILKKIRTTSEHPTGYQTVKDFVENDRVEFRKFTWWEGSSAIVDGRGMIHLKSADTNIPELTILLIIGREVAGWSAADKVTGIPYFIGTVTDGKLMNGLDFYKTYLRPFIAKIQKNAVKTKI